jgi:hypothetical protein
MTENALRCDTCQNYESGGQWCAFLKERISNLEFTLIERVGCGAHPDAITLTPALTAHYTERSQATGKPISQLVLQDLTALHKKRVAREEKRVWKEIEYERL